MLNLRRENENNGNRSKNGKNNKTVGGRGFNLCRNRNSILICKGKQENIYSSSRKKRSVRNDRDWWEKKETRYGIEKSCV